MNKRALIMSISVLAVLTVQGVLANEVGTNAVPQLDAVREKKASVILEVTLVGIQGGSKYNWQTVEPIRTLKNTTEKTFDKPLSVANYSWEPSVPKGKSIIYLVPYGGTNDLWRILAADKREDGSNKPPAN